MGMDIHIKLFKYDNERNQFKKLTLYRWDYKTGEYKEVYIYTGRNSEMFNGMTDGGSDSDGYGYFPASSIKLNSLFDPDREEIEKDMKATGFFDFNEINLAEMALYCKEHPRVVDYDVTWHNEDPNFVKPTKDNPICDLYKEICQYAAFADNWNWDFSPLSEYKIIFYFDH